MGMFAIGSGFVLIVGLIAIVIGLRGKISERGVYCKSCRFDLQGTRTDDPDAQCPECGSRVHHRDAQRDVLRRVSRVRVISGCVITLFAAGGLYISLFSTQASVFAYLPNQVVLSFAEKGYTDAVDEAIDRWMNVGDLTPDQQGQLIQHLPIGNIPPFDPVGTIDKATQQYRPRRVLPCGMHNQTCGEMGVNAAWR